MYVFIIMLHRIKNIINDFQDFYVYMHQWIYMLYVFQNWNFSFYSFSSFCCSSWIVLYNCFDRIYPLPLHIPNLLWFYHPCLCPIFMFIFASLYLSATSGCITFPIALSTTITEQQRKECDRDFGFEAKHSPVLILCTLPNWFPGLITVYYKKKLYTSSDEVRKTHSSLGVMLSH